MLRAGNTKVAKSQIQPSWGLCLVQDVDFTKQKARQCMIANGVKCCEEAALCALKESLFVHRRPGSLSGGGVLQVGS